MMDASYKWMRWTNAELDALGEWYYSASWEKLLKLLPGRSKTAIRGTAQRYNMHRRNDLPRDPNGAKISAERRKRKKQPFADHQHMPETKLRISVSNLHARGHDVAGIAEQTGIGEAEVRDMLDNRKERNRKKRNEYHSDWCARNQDKVHANRKRYNDRLKRMGEEAQKE
jgi:hypothetical protein